LSRAELQGASFLSAQLQGADLSSARLQGADFSTAELQGANFLSAQLQGADLSRAELQGAVFLSAQLQGADLSRAELQGASFLSAQLQGADLEGAEVWLAGFPPNLVTQSPVPLGGSNLNLSPLTTQHKTFLVERLQAHITDGALLKRLLTELNPILRDDPEKWEDEDSWSRYVAQTKEPSPDEVAVYLAHMACEDPEGHIAVAMAHRATDISEKRLYAKPLAKALLNEKCKGATALTDEMRATLGELGSAPE